MMSMRRKIAGLKPSEIRNLGREELDLPVTKQVGTHQSWAGSRSETKSGSGISLLDPDSNPDPGFESIGMWPT